ncbi:ABC transporter substrate-binding protein [Desulforapulum autotrophicum]|uniref:ABC transporter substrate-binding protein n=1 Tax=Desulforapulum autotrophicum TaxID=2296 RepID=UPI000308FF4B|nr:ABC transporter substrate-binding protein [Desulforapulum autotrophicum]
MRIFFIRIFLVLLVCLAPLERGRADAQSDPNPLLLVPASPAAIPLILAAQSLEHLEVKVFHNHSQAHALFLRGQAQLLSTGLSVGVHFFNQGVPVKIISSHVAGLSYLVSTRPVNGFGELAGQKIWLPFPGSPLEEICRFFAKQEGLVWTTDILVGYSMFDASVNMLKMHKIDFLPLPEPFVTLATKGASDLFVSLDFARLWEHYTGNPNGCPQVGTLVNKTWVGTHGDLIVLFNQALEQAIVLCAQDPDFAVKQSQPLLGFSLDVLRVALERTRFHLMTGQTLKDGVFDYYGTIGSPLDETFNEFF